MNADAAGGTGRGLAARPAAPSPEEDLRHAFTESFGGQRLPQRLGLQAPAGAVAERRLAATVLFADIRDFTSLAEKLDAAGVAELLTRFFERIAPALLDHGAQHLRFVGDALVAVFPAEARAPARAARRAIAAALAVALAAHAFRPWLAARFAGHGLPDFAIGIGLHAGEVTLSRCDGPQGGLTASGECIETAARLQAASKELGWTVVASQRVLHQAGAGVQTWGMTSLQVRGPRDWVDGAEIVGLEAAPADGESGAQAGAPRAQDIAEALRVNSEITARAVKGALRHRLSTLKGHRFAPDDAPLRLKGFRLTRKLGAGGMGEVYLGVRERDGLPVVLKVLQAAPPVTGAQLSRLVHEFALLSGVDDPHVVRIYGQGFGDDHAYLAMEYLEGGDLRGELRAGMARARALQVLAQLAQALQAIHARGIVHRDLKPENVLLRADGQVVLADFGIAGMPPPADAPPAAEPAWPAGVGTPFYLSPEQARGDAVTAASDLYSLGAMLYEMLAGQRPYAADSLAELLQRHLHAPVPRLPPQHQDLQPVLDRLMAKRPQDRYPSACALLDDLRARGLSSGETSRPRGQGPTPTIDR